MTNVEGDETVSEVFSKEEYQGERLTFKGSKPDGKATDIISAIQKSLKDRFPLDDVLKSIGIASFNNWPQPGFESDTIGG